MQLSLHDVFVTQCWHIKSVVSKTSPKERGGDCVETFVKLGELWLIIPLGCQNVGKYIFRVSFMWIGGQTQRCLLSCLKVGWPVHTGSISPRLTKVRHRHPMTRNMKGGDGKNCKICILAEHKVFTQFPPLLRTSSETLSLWNFPWFFKFHFVFVYTILIFLSRFSWYY